MLLLRNLLQFTEGETYYTVRPFDETFHQHAFGKATRVGNVLRSLPLPVSLANYKTCITSATALIEQTMGKVYADSYGWKWLVRSYLLTEMRVASIKGLQVSSGDSLSDLMVSFPDQCEWLSMLQRSHKKRKTPSTIKVKDLVRELNYKDPVEMLTCDLCVFGGKAARNFDIGDINAGKKVIQATNTELQRSADQQAHPLVVLKAALGK